MTARTRGSLGAALLLAASPAAVRQDAAERTAVALVETAGLVFVEVEWRGEPLLALVDTGASASAVDPRRTEDLPAVETVEVVGTTGTLPAETIELAGLRLGDLALPALLATRRDLGGLLAPPGRAVDLILGSDALAGLVVTLDFAGHRLEVAREADPDAPEGVPLELDDGIPCVEASLGGLDLRLRIDTGASLFDTPDVYVNVPTPVWRELCERYPELAPTSSLRGTGADGRSIDLPVAPVSGARIAGRELERVFVIVQPEAGYFATPDAKGFVGNNCLRRLGGRVTLDYRNGRLRPGG